MYKWVCVAHWASSSSQTWNNTYDENIYVVGTGRSYGNGAAVTISGDGIVMIDTSYADNNKSATGFGELKPGQSITVGTSNTNYNPQFYQTAYIYAYVPR